MKLTDLRIVLASNSPRRNELLLGIDIDFTVSTLPDIDESVPSDVPHDEIPVYLAKKKAQAYSSLITDDMLLITADTVVLINGEILGKPTKIEEAKEMLQKLSAKTHRVITGVCLTSQKKQVSFADVAYVTFGELAEDEIDYYLTAYSPMDKAGSYGVQEWIGYIGVEKIEGSYFNVMGLPIYKVYRELKKFGENTED